MKNGKYVLSALLALFSIVRCGVSEAVADEAGSKGGARGKRSVVVLSNAQKYAKETAAFKARIAGKKFKGDGSLKENLEISFTSSDKAEFEKEKEFTTDENGNFMLVIDKTGLLKDKDVLAITYLLDYATDKDNAVYKVYYQHKTGGTVKQSTDEKFTKVKLSEANNKVSIELVSTKTGKTEGTQKLATEES
ncbi:MAG: hypothetical protein ACRCV0_00970 [Brevinema sp.]